jgi:hypothetical protein
MNCQYCGRELPSSSRPSKRYCHNAHRQADYRQRHPVIATSLKHELEGARTRIQQLESLLATQKAKPSESHPRGQYDGLPKGCMSMRDFAHKYGVNPTTFRDHITIGIGKGLPSEQKDRVEAYERPKPRRSNETERYLTPKQQQAALDYWQRHRIPFHEVTE